MNPFWTPAKSRINQIVCVSIIAVLFIVSCQQDSESVVSTIPQSQDIKQEPKQSLLTFGPPEYVGREACSSCHENQSQKWKGSHHDLAMQIPGEGIILGDFNDATFSHFGVTSTFFKKDGKYFVNTDGPDGKLADFEVKYLFGFDPLQQVLIEFPGGRLQALSIAWDSRSQEQGGQRWYHLYSNEKMDHTDPLHWTGLYQNWNYMCAECHSTNLQKNYDLKSTSYQTNWSEIDVSCETCHGPASNHVEWAKSESSQNSSKEYLKKGLVVSLGNGDQGEWRFVPGKNTAQRTAPLSSRVQEETCARCHSRRSVIHDEYKNEAPFLDSYRLSLLDENLYHADGQINDEVYVYGSFLQSKMHRAGVVCSNCHDSHSLKLKAQGNELCAKCHSSEVFDKPSHYHHETDSVGSRCISCHMHEKKYMVVDLRRDHSFRIPRPDLSISLGTPNACNQCHKEKTPKWASEIVIKWIGKGRKYKNHFGEALHAGRIGLASANKGLVELARDDKQPDITRASAVKLLARYPSRTAAKAIIEGLRDPHPLVRMAAIEALEIFDTRQRFKHAESLLSDPVRAVRIEAGRVLSVVPRDSLTESQRLILNKAIEEYEKAQRVNADRPNAHLNLGIIYVNQRKWDKAEAEYKSSLKLDPNFVQGYINLADLYRYQGKDGEVEKILYSGLEKIQDNPEIFHSLGLLFVRQKRMPEAIQVLEKAANLRQENPRFGYVYAVALNSVGQPEKALTVLQKAQYNHPFNRDILFTLVTMNRDAGRLDSALKYVSKLTELEPEDPNYANLERHLMAIRDSK